MGGLGYIVGGALQGVGSGIVAQGQQRAAEDAATAKQRRDIALENLRSQNDQVNDARKAEMTHANRIAETEAEYKLRDLNDARSTGRKTSSQITIDTAKTKNDIVLAKVQTKLKLSADQAIKAQELFNSVTLAGQKVGETRVGADGAMVIYSETGKELTRSTPGQFIPQGSKSEDDSGGTIGAARAARGTPVGQAAPQPTPAPKPASKPTAQAPTVIKYDAHGNRIK